MNVRIFWVRAMKCMCAQTRPRFILSSERVFFFFGEWSFPPFFPMLTPGEKCPLPENFPRGESNPRRCGQRAQTLPTSYSGPQRAGMILTHFWQSLENSRSWSLMNSTLRFWFTWASFWIPKNLYPFETDTKGSHSVVVCVTWTTDRNWQTNILNTRKVTRLNLPRQASVKQERTEAWMNRGK